MKTISTHVIVSDGTFKCHLSYDFKEAMVGAISDLILTAKQTFS